MPVTRKVFIEETAQYAVEIEVEDGLDNEAIEDAALEKFLAREDPNEGFIAVLDRDVHVEK